MSALLAGRGFTAVMHTVLRSTSWTLLSSSLCMCRDLGGAGLGWSKPLGKLLYASTANQDPLVLQVGDSQQLLSTQPLFLVALHD